MYFIMKGSDISRFLHYFTKIPSEWVIWEYQTHQHGMTVSLFLLYFVHYAATL